jgi:hypothetical protein
MLVKGRILAFAASLVVGLVLAASAWAGAYTYAGNSYWPAGLSAATWFSPSWYRNAFYKNATFDTTITFIDNVSYSWHATVRSRSQYVETHWLSWQVKKAYCRANTSGPYGACVAYY